MGLKSESDANESMKLCVFDLRRGQTEGQELDKILFFYPPDLPLSNQLSVIGLSEGLITFTRIFSPDAPCEVIEAEKHSHVFYEAEPDIWMVLVVEKDSEAIWRVDALRSVLKEVHSLFVMFHGYVRALVDKEPSGGLVRSHLYYFIMDFLRDFSIGKKLQLPNFRGSLKEQGTLQMLTVGREAAIEVQSLVTVLESCVGNTQCYTMTMFQDLLVSTNLSPIDSLNLFTYAVLRLTPLALFHGASSWSHSRKTDTACNTYAGALLLSSGSAMDPYYNSRDTSPLRRHSYPLVRPLQHSKWSKGKDGFLTTDIWGTEVNSLVPTCPTIWLHQTEEKMFLLAYQHRGLTVILLVPVSSISGEQGIAMLKQQIIENASLKMLKVEEKLSRGWGGENAYHVSGYRYLLVDGDRYISRASPPGKVTTLTKESLIALSKLREEVDSEKVRVKWDNSSCEKDLEICIRAKNNAWLIARLIRGKELYMVLEKASETLLYASDAAEKFSERYCNGAFSLD
ncbi:vacuolar fusion CCZ1-like protein [Perilla frutescens var. hirtella]|uniref:Vacuolar fusion CCZ1-like protein n=1 Tax=Perilla frutescens var. hirtella TaxID=608512 RepID=A0AAD4J897_PERFH|nr:vacuolar fusion CCZ1-like protein [Perilla frutescens var. frutescens]KAH6784435.1 vacuolar fusion CCZ1-like protein [Perilla frutescens var. hirtella]KAH6828435.1 vacuolar fusion CCZ1-like protein [Perilla frutescens var. hirtella]